MGFYIFILGFCAVLISALGAAFSVHGLASLFSGAFIAVAVMASALELGKLVIATFLHQYWKRLNILLRTYLVLAVVTLMCITSMGIFGFLSNAYQTSSIDINRLNLQIAAAEEQHKHSTAEVERMYKLIDEIPAEQTTRKIQMQKRFDPLVQDYTRKANEALSTLNNLKLEQLNSQSKVGPLIYVARAFGTNIDTVVKWLILVFVMVFDPLAICLVIATSSALRFRDEDQQTTPTKLEVMEPKISEEPAASLAMPLKESA